MARPPDRVMVAVARVPYGAAMPDQPDPPSQPDEWRVYKSDPSPDPEPEADAPQSTTPLSPYTPPAQQVPYGAGRPP